VDKENAFSSLAFDKEGRKDKEDGLEDNEAGRTTIYSQKN
jgi:hypothetical protein